MLLPAANAKPTAAEATSRDVGIIIGIIVCLALFIALILIVILYRSVNAVSLCPTSISMHKLIVRNRDQQFLS